MSEIYRRYPHARSSRIQNGPKHRLARGRTTAFERLESRQLLAVDVLTYRNDNSGAGANLLETQLSPASVLPGGAFGKLFAFNTDGQIYGAPLVKTGVTIVDGPNTTAGAAGLHDVVFVTTEHDSVYAVDTSLTASVRILWQRGFLSASDPNDALPGATSVTTFANAFDVAPEVGITGTPVIDPSTNLLYVVTKTQETVGGVTHYVQRLHALNIANGADATTPFLIADSIDTKTNNTQIFVYGKSDGTDTVVDPYNGTGKTVVQFNALREFQRCALSFVNNTLYVEWASHNDATPYHGWIVAWDVSHLATSGFQLKGVFNDSPNGNEGGIWEGGGTLAFEPNGSAFYLETGNGPGGKGVSALDANGFPIDGNYYNALLKIIPDATTSPTHQNINGWGLSLADYFIPFNTLALDNTDGDFGSGGPVLLPDSAGIAGHPHLLAAAGKQGKIYLVDRDNLGKYDPNNDHVINAVPDGSGHNSPPVLIAGTLNTSAYYNGKIYAVSGYQSIAKAFTIAPNGAIAAASQTTATFGTLPGSPVISAAGTTNGIVWIMDRNASQIHAYDAGSLSTELWNSGMKVGGADAVGAVTKFGTPTVAEGQVYVGTLTSLVVYGTQPPANSVPTAPVLSASPLSNSSISLFWTDPSVRPNTASGYSIEQSLDNVNFTSATTAPGGSTTISIGGLSPQTTYYFRIRGFNGIGNSPYSNTASAATSNQIPALDFSLGFVGAAPGKLTLNGSALLGGSKLELTSSLQSQTGSAFSSSRVDVSRFSTQFTFNLTAGSTTSDGFTFVIQGNSPTAIGGGGGGIGYSGMGKSVAIKFDLYNNVGEGPDSTGLYTGGHSPDNFNSIDLSSTGIDLHSGDIFLFSATYDGATLAVNIKDTNTGAVATQSYTVNIPTFVGGTSAYVGFTGSTGAQTTQQDILTWTYTPTTAAAPSAPSALGATPTTATAVSLTWANNSTNQAGFKLDRANDANFTQSLLTLVLPAAPNSYTDSTVGLAPGGTYYYRLRATNNAGDSANSNVVSVSIPIAPPTPTGATVTGVAASEIDLSWTDNAGHAATGYIVQRRVGSGAFTNVATLPAKNATPPSPYTWSDLAVTPGTAYEYHIVAFNTSGNNDFTGTNTISLTLSPSVTATARGNSIALSWAAVPGAVAYNIYRGTATGGESLLAGGVISPSFADRGVNGVSKYYYVVTALNANVAPMANESAKSNEVSATLVLAANYSSTAPSDLVAGGSITYSVTVTNTGTQTWSASAVNAVHLGVYFNGNSDAISDWQSEPTRFLLPGDVAPGASATINVTVPAPTAPGTYVLRQRLVQENVAWFGQLLATPVLVENLAATYAGTPPTAWAIGSTNSYQVTVTNTGSSPWAAGGANPVQLTTYFGGASDTPGAWVAAPIVTPLSADVAPGQSQTIVVTASAPSAAGSYTLRTRLNKPNVAWFSQMLKTTVTVTGTQPTLAAMYASSPPTIWYAGQTQSYSITLTNQGSQTWNATGANLVHLGVYFGGASDAAGPAGWSVEPKRFTLPSDVAPGQSVTMTLSLAAPTTGGTYILRARMVKEGVTWFDSMQKTSVTVAALSASYVANPPLNWTPGQTQTYPVTVTNTSNVTWNAVGSDAVHMGVYFGGASDVAGSWTTEPMRVNLPADLASGASITLNVTISAPSAPGSYVLRERMVKEQVAWFATMLRTNVTVASATTAAALRIVGAAAISAPPTVYLAAATGGPPATVKAGASLAFFLSLVNNGADIWKTAGASRVGVAVYFDLAGAAPPTKPVASLNLASDVAVGAETQLPIRITVPKQKGSYVMRVRLIGDDGAVSDYILQTPVALN